MKKAFLVCLVLALMLSAAACAAGGHSSPQPSGSTAPSDRPIEPSSTAPSDRPIEPSSTAPGDTPIAPADPYQVLVAWVNWSECSDIYTKSLNYEMMSISSVRHLPIFKCESVNDLEAFQNQFKDALSFSSGYDEAPSFAEATAGFGADFFQDSTLFLVYVTAGSGSLRFALDRFSVKDGTFRADIVQTNNPEISTDDMAGWLIIIPVHNDRLQNVQSYDAIMK